MKENSKLWTGLILGAAAGAAVTMFAKSKKGQEVISNVNNKMTNLKDATVEVVQEEWSNLSNKSELVRKEAAALAEEVSKIAVNRAGNIKSAINGKS